jgi:hydroxymethylpyrimidine kinase/phosphomethylpyrimidine kinase
MKIKTPRALTIAGSDSGGGAGIQSDLKTFAALGVYGTSAITSITAQNTRAVTSMLSIDPETVRAQIRAVVEDIGVDTIKTGMLHTPEVIHTVAEEIDSLKVPVIVDPVMVSNSGMKLIQENAIEVMRKKLFPLATVLTPNKMEAERLSGLEIHSLEDARKVAKNLVSQGASAVVVKGGHLPTKDKAIDILYNKGDFHIFETVRVETMNTHGTGCAFASAIAAEMAKGKPLIEAVGSAKTFVTDAIKFSYSLGGGHGPVNIFAGLYREGERYHVLREVSEAVRLLEARPEVALLIPETSSNIVMASTLADGPLDVAAVPGRISKVERGVSASGCPAFGASHHLAGMVLVAMERDPSVRAAMNIRYSDDVLSICGEMKTVISSYYRGEEPSEVKRTEGGSTTWGMRQAIEKIGKVPDIVYHKGDWGKEPMIVILGRSAIDVARVALSIAKRVVEVSE